MMSDKKKTKEQLIEELQRLRARVSENEPSASSPYNALFESAAEGILIADIASRRFVDANPAICRMLGYTREQLVGMSVKDIHPPESLDQVSRDFTAQARGQKAVVHELPCLKSDGTVFYADITAGNVVLDGMPCAAGFFSDVTERRRAYDLARLQCNLAIDLNSEDDLNATLRQCLDTAIAASELDSGGIYLVDTATGGLELQCHSGLSHRFVSMGTHYDAEAPNTRFVMSGKPTYMTHSELLKMLKGSQRLEHLRASAVIPVLHAGRVIACLNISSHTVDDIPPDARRILEGIAATIGSTVSRLRAEQALTATEARYHEIFSTIQEGIGIVGENETILLANQAYARIFDEESVDAIIGRSLLEFLPDDHRETVRQQTEQRRANKSSQYELDIVTRKGNRKSLFASVTPRFTSEGRYIGAVGAVLDITESKRAEKGLCESQALLKSITDGTTDAIYVKDLQGRYKFFNAAAESVVGKRAEVVLGKDDYAIFPPSEAATIMEGDRKIIAGRSASTYEEVVTDSAGRIVTYLSTKGPVFDSSGKIIGLFGVARDITERKRAEVALRKSEALLSVQFTNSPDIILIINRDYKIVIINKVPSGRFTAAELVGMDCIEILPPEVRDESRRRVAECFKTGEMQEFEHRLVKGIWVRACLVRIGDGSESDQVMIISADITERKRAEEALHTAEEQYRLLFERAGEGIFVAQDGKIVLSNPAVTAISGYSPEELSLQPFTEFIHPEDRELILDRHRRRLSGEDIPTSYDFRVVTREGEVKIVNISSTVISWNGRPATLNFLADVTARRQAEEEIRKFKTISDNASYGTQIISPDATFLYVNRTFAEMHGYSPEELIGRHVSLCHTEQQMDMVSAGIQEVFRIGAFSSREVWHVHRNGTEFPTLMSGSVINDASGQPQYMATTTVDITELKRLQELADRAHRLEAAGRIAGQVAHDFNNLLGPLVAYPGIIREELGAGHPVNAYLEPMEAAAQQMADINQQLLTLGRRGHYTLEPLDLNEVIRQVLKQIQSQCTNLTVVADLAADLMNVSGGVAQIARVMTNLITNAVDAMQGIGTLTITSENWYAEEAQGKYGRIAQGEYVKLTISDTGCGIPEDVMPHVFEPFFTTKKTDRKRGSGLGLSVVHAVVEDHHGYVEIDSVAGKGTSIYLYFPITREEISHSDETIVSGGNESVLVVDDDAIQREVALKLLQQLGYRAEAVDGGEVALQRLQSESFDLLILDMVMPGGPDGADTYRRAKELHPDQKAIIVSGFAESDRVSEVQRMGAGDFIKKPLTLKSLAVSARCELDREHVAEPTY
jgi:PAS domain S-box-containing protein